MQSPLAAAAGVGIFFSIPKAFSTGESHLDKQSIRQKLARVDYAGAILLVSSLEPLLSCSEAFILSDQSTNHIFLRTDFLACPFSNLPLLPNHNSSPNPPLDGSTNPVRPERSLPIVHAHHPHDCPTLARRPLHLHRPIRSHDGSLDRPLLHSCLRHRRPRLGPRHRWLHPHPYESRLCPRRTPRWLDPYPPRRKLLYCVRHRLCHLSPLSLHPRLSLHARHARVAIPDLHAPRRLRHRRRPELHPRAPPAPHPALHARNLHLTPRHVSRLRR